MSPLFHVAELVRIGVEDEKSGVAFYETLARKTGDDELRKTYEGLAQQERCHQKRFEDLLDELGNVQPTETYPGEYIAYLRAMLDSRAFRAPDAAARMARRCKDDAAALDLAIRFERDTLILMKELREMVPAKDREVVDDLAREEQGHLVELGRARQRLAP